MAENLFPEDPVEILEEEVAEEQSAIGYVGSIFFDETIGDFARDGQNNLKISTGLEAWEQWCINCLLTERGAYPSYGDVFGIETKEAFESDSREETESILTVEITEALMNDPYGRTEYVENIEYNWINSDQLEIEVTVRGIEDVTIDITAAIDARER